MVCVCVCARSCARTYLMLQLQHLGPVKLLDSFLRSNKSNINQSARLEFSIFARKNHKILMQSRVQWWGTSALR